MTDTFRVGTVITPQGTLTDLNGVLWDPTEVIISLLKPTDPTTQVDYRYTLSQVTRVSAGVYQVSAVLLDVAGIWHFRVEVPNEVSGEVPFRVLPSAFP